GDVIFMFQPGEEGPGGAEIMIEEGVLDVAGRRPIAAYGLHVGPQDRGTFHYINGPTMASSSNLAVTVYGKGGHGSRPHDAVDPVTCLAEIITSLQTAITRRFDALEPIVLTVTNLRAGDGAFNAIPDQASFSATVRVLRDEQINAVRQVIGEVTSNIAAAHRCSVEVDFEVLYPTTKTNARENQFAATVWGAQFGPDSIRQFEAPMMASEDFGAVLAQVPGSFFWLGTANPQTPYAQR
ncbi:amidohydrolase, partial [Rhodococcus erythropolis]